LEGAEIGNSALAIGASAGALGTQKKMRLRKKGGNSRRIVYWGYPEGEL